MQWFWTQLWGVLTDSVFFLQWKCLNCYCAWKIPQNKKYILTRESWTMRVREREKEDIISGNLVTSAKKALSHWAAKVKKFLLLLLHNSFFYIIIASNINNNNKNWEKYLNKQANRIKLDISISLTRSLVNRLFHDLNCAIKTSQ